ncbi:MAG: nucleoside recognition domain-containing protein [Oscillospiraceae bacterium]
MSHALHQQWVRDLCLGCALLLSVAGLLFFPAAAMEGARAGLSLCYNVIIPSLFPFFVLSSLVVELGLAAYLGRALEHLMRPLFRVPGVCSAAFVLGFVGGYPVGARTAIELYENGMCTKTEGERLLAFCNNSGPAFILGVVGVGIFSSPAVGVLLYLCHIAASLCVGFLFRFYKGSETGRPTKTEQLFHVEQFSVAFPSCIKSSFSSVLNICAFVLFFAVALRLFSASGILPFLAELLGRLFAPLGFSALWGERLLTGLLELSSGVASLSGGGGSLSMAAFMLGWAGLSVHCQVLSFLGGSDLSPRTYLVGKLLHGSLSALFVWLVTRFFLPAETVSVYLAEQVGQLVELEFSSTLAGAAVASFLVFLFFFFLAFSCGKKRKPVIQCKKRGRTRSSWRGTHHAV